MMVSDQNSWVKKLLLLLFLLSSFSSTSATSSTSSMANDAFKTMDADGSGLLSTSELTRALPGAAKQVISDHERSDGDSANDNGELDEEEFATLFDKIVSAANDQIVSIAGPCMDGSFSSYTRGFHASTVQRRNQALADYSGDQRAAAAATVASSRSFVKAAKLAIPSFLPLVG